MRYPYFTRSPIYFVKALVFAACFPMCGFCSVWFYEYCCSSSVVTTGTRWKPSSLNLTATCSCPKGCLTVCRSLATGDLATPNSLCGLHRADGGLCLGKNDPLATAFCFILTSCSSMGRAFFESWTLMSQLLLHSAQRGLQSLSRSTLTMWSNVSSTIT